MEIKGLEMVQQTLQEGWQLYLSYTSNPSVYVLTFYLFFIFWWYEKNKTLKYVLFCLLQTQML